MDESFISQIYCDWLNDPTINSYLETRHQLQTLDSLFDYYNLISSNSDNHWFAILSPCTDAHVGNIKLTIKSDIYLVGEISLFIGSKKHHNLGIASSAVHQICDYGFAELSLYKLVAYIYEPNIASIKCFSKNGFIQECCLLGEVISNNKRCNVFRYVKFNV